MSTGLIDIMKRAAMEVNDNAQMSDLRFGTVVSTSPLKVQVTNLLTIPSSALVVPEHLTDYKVSVTIDWDTEEHTYTHTHTISDTYSGGGSAGDHEHTHRHDVSGKKSIIIHNALKKGDKVALLRKQGGQSYFILDRI